MTPTEIAEDADLTDWQVRELAKRKKGHQPLLELEGKIIRGLKRCKFCGLSETYWKRFPDCGEPEPKWKAVVLWIPRIFWLAVTKKSDEGRT